MNLFRSLASILCVTNLYTCATVDTGCAADTRATHTPKKHYALGYVPDSKFPKGVLTFENSPWSKTPVAQSVDLTALMIPDDDQGQVGRCTGFGLARAVSSSLKKQYGGQFSIFSPDFIYYNERVIMGTVSQDSGAMIGEDGITSLKAQGACYLKTWPLTSGLNTKKPCTSTFAEGKKHLVLQAYKVDNRNGQDLERAMSAGFVVVYGITLHEEFENLNSFNFTYHGTGSVIGGHCMVFFKYDLKAGMILSHNQWGDQWALHDIFKMPLSIAHSSAVDDCYVIYAVMK